MFGPHLMMDIWGCSKDVLSNLDVVFNYLNDTPDKIGMTKITQPHVFPYMGLVPEDKGITGTVIIAESHLSVHTFAEKGYAFFDIFSCKPFDVEIVVEEILRVFQPQHHEKWLSIRGRQFPR